MKITPEIVRELLDYNPETGIFTWKSRGLHWFKLQRDCNAYNANYAGKRAGTTATNSRGYTIRQIGLLGKTRKEHHLAWMCMTNDPVPPVIDHTNRDATDNRWCNIKASSYPQNSKNKSMKSENKSGFTGVSWHRLSSKWRARCVVDGKEKCIGYFTEKQDAADAVLEFRMQGGYNPEHGATRAWYSKDLNAMRPAGAEKA